MSDKCSHEWINALACTKCGKVARSSHTCDDGVTCTERICCLQQELAHANAAANAAAYAEAKLAEALKRIAELEAELAEVKTQRDQLCDEYDTFQCDIASAFDWQLEGRPFPEAIRELKAERDALRAALTLVLNQGHNDDCIFCGFKDKVAQDALAQGGEGR